MTDDFFEVRFTYFLYDVTIADVIKDVASRHQEYKVPFGADSTIPHTRPVAGARPFSRSIEDWKVPHPKITLDSHMYPIFSTLRTTSKWSLPATYGVPTDHRSGHNVPPGPRSGWSRAQYSVYKEEQASWRRNRDEVRSEGIKRKLQQDRHELAENKVPYGNKTKEVRLENESGGSSGCLVRSFAISGILEPGSRNRLSPGPVMDLTVNQEDLIDLTGSEDAAGDSEEDEDEDEGEKNLILLVDAYEKTPTPAPRPGKLLNRTVAIPRTNPSGSGPRGKGGTRPLALCLARTYL
jgi:hypothetical protein